MIYDLIVIGSGAAGLTGALEGQGNILVITKTNSFTSGSSPLAQGGIAASVGKDDSPNLHYIDTVIAGGNSGLSKEIEFLTTMGPRAIDALLGFNMHFDLDSQGNLDRNHEAAHSRRRVLKAGGDATGRILVETLYNEALKRKNISWKTNTFVWDLIIVDDCICGVTVYSENGWENIYTPRVLLATGGLGQLFGHTTNPVEATGDSMALALRHNFKLKEIEMVQFHPTALNAGEGESLKLLTEALRGDGGFLVREDGAQFMGKYSLQKDLAPRDVVARGIWTEIKNGHRVYLDLRGIEDIKNKFPTVTSICLKEGLNPRRDLIPVIPGVHYVMGGIDINSPLPRGLGVAGEAAYTGVHGANRLASNSLLECLVYGKSQVQKIMKENHVVTIRPVNSPDLQVPSLGVSNQYKKRIQHIIYNYCGIVRNSQGLGYALNNLCDLSREIESLKVENQNKDYLEIRSWLEVKNMIILGISLVKSAIYRKESRGAHYREDFPQRDPKWDRIELGGNKC